MDTISRQAAIDTIRRIKANYCEFADDQILLIDKAMAMTELMILPSVQPEPISEAYAKAVFAWLLDYQIKAAEMKGRYIPYEVLSWVANDWRKENERSN